jgi:hypothetical protein
MTVYGKMLTVKALWLGFRNMRGSLNRVDPLPLQRPNASSALCNLMRCNFHAACNPHHAHNTRSLDPQERLTSSPSPRTTHSHTACNPRMPSGQPSGHYMNHCIGR